MRSLNELIGIVLIALTLVVAGCTPSTSKQMEGHYVAQLKYQSIELHLKPDGAYDQILHVPQKTPQVISSGNWVYFPEKSRIDFTNLRTVVDKECAKESVCLLGDPSNASFPVERNNLVGSLRIGVEFDDPYVKQD